MAGVIVTGIPRATLAQADELARYGVATIHEAMGRSGLLGSKLRPIQQGVTISGTAVTVECWPGDNLMVHAAVEQTCIGDILVVTTVSPSEHGAFGEMLATSLASRGVRGLVTTTGVRDVAQLRRLGFPVWSAAVSPQGTAKEAGGSVNVPIVLNGTTVEPGDVVVCDDDGVVCVPRGQVEEVVQSSRSREQKEDGLRAVLASGVLGLDLYGLRGALQRAGVEYRSAS